MNRLTDLEFEIIQDKTFLLTKARAISKIESVLSETRKELKTFLIENPLHYPELSHFKTDKISKGENYLGLPYLVLDYPAVFSKENIFAYRTMFWWGNFFSTTIHMEGEPLNYYRKTIAKNIDRLIDSKVYICTGETPWQYHYGKDNYELASEHHQSLIEECNFLKLSKKIDLTEWERLPEISLQFFEMLSQVFSNA